MRNLYCGLLFIVLCAYSLTACKKENNEATKIVLATSKMTIGIGETAVIYANPFPDGSGKASLKWSSDDESIATVDQKGNVTGVSNGSTYINIEYKGLSENVLIEVYQPLTDITLTPATTTVNLEILFGAAASFKYEVAPVPSTSNETIIWKSADPNIASVTQAGLITAMDAGTTTVSVEGSGGVVKKTINVTVTKVGEDPVKFDRSLFVHRQLPGDNAFDRNEWWPIKNLFDGNRAVAGGSQCGRPAPHSVTLDLGKVGKLAYFHLFTWKSLGEGFPPFSEANIKKFEVWGAEVLDESGDWASWTKLMDCEVTKPSGLPLGQYNADDIQASDLGQKFYNTANYDTKIRYVRIKVTETWEGMSCFRACEFEFYGKQD